MNIIVYVLGTERIRKEYYEQLYNNQFDNLGEMDKFLEKHKLLT